MNIHRTGNHIADAADLAGPFVLHRFGSCVYRAECQFVQL